MAASHRFLLFSVFIGIFNISSFSADATTCNATSCSGNVNELFDNFYLSPSGNGRVFLHIRGTVNKDALDCTLVENRFVTLLSSHTLFPEMYSSLLSASALNKKVMVRIVDKSPVCEVNYIRYFN